MINYDQLPKKLAILTFGSFIVGAVAWKMSSNLKKDDRAHYRVQEDLSPDATIATVGQRPISNLDIQWEMELLQKNSDPEQEDLTSIPDNGDIKKQVNKSLRELVVTSLIERKVLYAYAEKDRDFDFKNPSRYSSCIEQWTAEIADNPEFDDEADRERLKQRYCEVSIVAQYLDEVIYKSTHPSQSDVNTYYQNNSDQFKIPATATIRQIVLASEKEAKKVRHRLTRSNFADRAKEYSISPESAQGGLIGPFKKGELLPVFDIAFSMRRGEIRGILKSPYGFHFIMLEERTKARTMSMAEASSQIRPLLTEKNKELAYQKHVKNALISVDVTRPKPIW
jgi:peptidyl-prolyl cis-trans isomerase C